MRRFKGTNRAMNLTKGLLLVAITAGFALASGDALAASTGEGETGSGDPADFSSAWFIAPLPNASYETAPVTIDAEIGVHQGLDGGPIATVEVAVDGDSLGPMACAAGCTFVDIQLDKGVHLLELLADNGYDASVTVYVDEEVPSDTTTETGQDDDGGAETAGATGRGCSVQDGPISPWALLTLPLLLLVPGFRREH
jgi:hypothetical protein